MLGDCTKVALVSSIDLLTYGTGGGEWDGGRGGDVGDKGVLVGDLT